MIFMLSSYFFYKKILLFLDEIDAQNFIFNENNI
jgi:hypothetical protein